MKRPFLIIILINVLNFLDMITTRIGLKLGLQEVNPLAKALFDNNLAFINNLYKGLLMFFVTLTLFYQLIICKHKMEESKDFKMGYYFTYGMMILILAIYIWLVLSNTYNIIGAWR